VYSTKVVDTNTLIVTKMLEVGVADMAWSPDGQLLYTVGYEWKNRRNSEKIVKAWDTRTWREVHRGENLFTRVPLDGVWSAPEGSGISEAPIRSWGSWQIYLYDTVAEQPLGNFVPHHIVTIFTSINSNGHLLVTSGGDAMQCQKLQTSWWISSECKVTASSTRIWDIRSLKMLAEWSIPLFDVVFSPDSRMIVGHTQNALEVWNWESHQLLWTTAANIGSHCVLNSYRNFYGYYWCLSRESGLAIDASSEYLAEYNVATGSTVRLYRLTTGELIATLTGHTAPITGVAFSPDGTKIAASSQDGTILIWDVP
jgi:WD40 repeat protein